MSAAETEDDGVVVLARPDVAYADGAEDALLALVRAATDLSSTSEELAALATTWAEEYHLDPTRAHVLRALDLPAEAEVLEVGAGCGAISRYLGEVCAKVDALEPMIDRARVARARTRDLDNVRVLLGEVGDLPDEPTYDVVVVIGVLEYVGDGTREDPAYGRFLADIARRLRPGGQLVLAIENKLGVKYLAGAPEDHTDRPFEGLEDYPVSSGVRTFARRELLGLMTGAGFTPRPLLAFPDYKMTRTLLAPEEFPRGTEALLTAIPVFPSPDRPETPRVFDEAAGWRVLVDAGLAAETGNSFVVIATKDEAAPVLWPADRAAVYFSHARRTAAATVTTVTRAGDRLTFRRRPLAPLAQTGPRVVASEEAFVAGEDLPDVVARDGLEAARGHLERWAELVAADPTALDLVPHNLVVTAAGPVPIDQEWRDPDADAARVLRRGALLLAERLVGRAGPVWGPDTTVAAAAHAIGAVVGLEPGEDWLGTAVEEEARFNAFAAAARPDLTGPERVRYFAEAHRGGLRLMLRPGVPTTADLVATHLAGGEDGAAWDAVVARLDDPDTEVAALLAVAQEQRRDVTERFLETRRHARNLEALVADLRAQADARSAEVADWRQHAANLEDVVANLEDLVAHLRRDLGEAQQAAASAGRAEGLARQVESMRASLSWRVTRPLRALRGQGS